MKPIALKLRGLPYTVCHDDIVSFFQDYDFDVNSVKIGENAYGKRTGEAVLVFKTPEEAERAKREKQGANIGPRYIEIFPLASQEYQQFENK